jgi:hypothetical protein
MPRPVTPLTKQMNFCGGRVDPVAEGGSYAGAFTSERRNHNHR